MRGSLLSSLVFVNLVATAPAAAQEGSVDQPPAEGDIVVTAQKREQ